MSMTFVLLTLLTVTPPAPHRWVTDEAGLLSPQVRAQLDRRLQVAEHAYGHEVLVWIARSTEGEPHEAFARRTFDAWRVGRERLDTGAVLFVFPEDGAVRLQVGSALGHLLTPSITSRIIDERIAPLLEAGEPDVAISSGVDALMTHLTGAPLDAPATIDELSASQWITLGLSLLGLLLVFFIGRRGLARHLVSRLFLRRGARTSHG